MANEGPFQQVLPGVVCDASLVGAAVDVQFCFVKITGERTVGLCTAATDVPCGVLQEVPHATGMAVEVVAKGITKVQIAAGSPAANDPIGTDANAQAAVYAVTDTTVYSVGRVIDANSATTAGALVTALVNCINPARFA